MEKGTSNKKLARQLAKDLWDAALPEVKSVYERKNSDMRLARKQSKPKPKPDPKRKAAATESAPRFKKAKAAMPAELPPSAAWMTQGLSLGAPSNYAWH